jgi:glycosyltransferase involved in cell wall biosynthesis
MARGCPVLVTESVGAAELVCAAGGGVVIEAGQLACALRDLLADDARLATFGVAGESWVEENLCWQRVAGTMEECYRRAAAGSRCAADGTVMS